MGPLWQGEKDQRCGYAMAAAGDNAGSARYVSVFLPPSLDSSAAPSTATIAAPHAGILHCNNAVSPAADKNAARIPSADSTASAGAGRAVGRVPDLRAGV